MVPDRLPLDVRGEVGLGVWVPHAASLIWVEGHVEVFDRDGIFWGGGVEVELSSLDG